MDWIRVHLAVNHISVIGMPFLLALLTWGWVRRSDPILRVAIWWIVLLSVISIALKFTGDFAAEQGVAKFDDSRAYVNRHEQAADQATTGVFLLGIAGAIGLVKGRRGKPFPKWSLLLILALGMSTCILFARTANLGGQITHSELR